MTQYISSFLIEPIVQQARRLSRSSNPTRPDPHHLVQDPSSSTHDGEITSAEASSLDPGDATQQPQIISHVIADDITVSSISDNNDDDDVVQRDTTEHEPIPFGRESPAIDADTSDNPSHSVRHSFQSSSGSANSSVDSVTSHLSRGGEGMPPLRMAPGRFRAPASAGGLPRRKIDNPIPADDGMRVLRSRILAIQSSTSSQEEKARLVHTLMTEAYTSSRPALQSISSHDKSGSPNSLKSVERPATPLSTMSIDNVLNPSSPPAYSSSAVPLPAVITVGPEDRLPTYYQETSMFRRRMIPAGERPTRREADSSVSLSSEVDTSIPTPDRTLGCAHYKRNIKLQCSTCSKWYTCRFCHDEVEDHPLIRKETKNMLCMLCGHAQPAGGHCIECVERTAWYFCNVCKLWDDDTEKNIYHCDDCGICRVGKGLGKDFFHCKVGSFNFPHLAVS